MSALPAFGAPTLLVSRDAGQAEAIYRYQIAGLDLAIDQPLADLDEFRASAAGSAKALPHIFRGAHHGSAREPHSWARSTRGLVGNRLRTVRLRGSPNGMTVELEDLGSYELKGSGQLFYPSSVTSTQLAQVLCGPLLPLALSQLNTYCLHAAALRHTRGLTLLLGVSGAGKSTLSKALAEQGAALWADDTVPVSCNAASAFCPGHYPQPKWPRWRSGIGEPDCPVTHLVCLNPNGVAEPGLVPLPAAAAALALVEHTLAGRLFSPAGLRNHLKFAASLAQHTMVFRMDYARQPTALPAMQRCLQELTPWL